MRKSRYYGLGVWLAVSVTFYLTAVVSAGSNGDLCWSNRDKFEAKILIDQGHYKEALPLLERALASGEEAVGPENPDMLGLLDDLANDYILMCNYAKALSLKERALAIRVKALGPEHWDTLSSLKDVAGLYHDTGDYAKAVTLYVRALEIVERKKLPYTEKEEVLANLATTYQRLGDYAKAVTLHERALAIDEEFLGPVDPRTGGALNNLANDYQHMGDYAKAVTLHKRALEIFDTKTEGWEDPDTGSVLDNLANDYQKMGTYAKAVSLHERALAIFEKTLGPEHTATAGTLFNLANDYQLMGNYAKAVSLHERALAIFEKTLGPDHPNTAATLGGLADNYQHMGDYVKAVSLHERALAIFEKTLGPDHSNTVNKYYSIAKLQDLKGSDLSAIREPLSKWYSGNEKQMNQILTMDELTRLSWQKENLQNDMIDLLSPEQRTQFILRTKGVVLDSLMKDEATMKRLDDQAKHNLRFARSRIGQIAFSTKKEDQQELAKLKAMIDYILSSATHQKEYAQGRESATITPDVMASAMPTGGILVEFIQFTDPKIKLDAGRCYGALILGGDGVSKFVRIDDAVGIDASVRALREAIAKGDEKALAEQQKLLSEKLWKPLTKNLPEGTKKLFIGADGQLNFLSFATLPAPDGSFLAEHYDIAYVGSGRDLARKVTPSDSKSIALFADPLFDRQASSFGTNALAMRSGEVDAFGKIVLPPLPGTKAEEAAVEEVAKAGGWSPEVHLGEKAAKPDLLDLKSPGILHLATHGFYLNTLQENGTGGEGERGMKVLESFDVTKPAPPPKIDPMHASGIALTGAQATLRAWSEGRVPDPKEDGILTAEEVAGLDLEGTWLVTLSACETGVGEARSGEGVFGLRRAFMIAGAQNLLMTLWPVSDEVTPKIMAKFYKEALATHDAAGSLAKVQRDWLVKLRKEKGLLAAVRDAGPFAMVVMAKQDSTFSSPSTAVPMTASQAPAPALTNPLLPTNSPTAALPPTSTNQLVTTNSPAILEASPSPSPTPSLTPTPSLPAPEAPIPASTPTPSPLPSATPAVSETQNLKKAA